MNKLLLLAIISVASLVILRTTGIQTDIPVVDQWVDTVLTALN